MSAYVYGDSDTEIGPQSMIPLYSSEFINIKLPEHHVYNDQNTYNNRQYNLVKVNGLKNLFV